MNNIDHEHQNKDFDGDVVLSSKNGFIGKALVYDEEIYVNTFTGEGYEAVLKKMDDYISWYSGKIRLSGFERNDIKQLIITFILDGIRRYNPTLKIKLSTFLYVHIKNRMASRIQDECQHSLNATYYKPVLHFTCNCKASFVSPRDEALEVKCFNCDKTPDDTWFVREEKYEPYSLDTLLAMENTEEKGGRTIEGSEYAELLGRSIHSIEEIESAIDINTILCKENGPTKRVAELVIMNDYTISEAAKEIGMSCWATSLKFKRLQAKRKIKEFFDK